MTGLLKWHVQTFLVIGQIFYEQEYYKIFIEFWIQTEYH